MRNPSSTEKRPLFLILPKTCFYLRFYTENSAISQADDSIFYRISAYKIETIMADRSLSMRIVCPLCGVLVGEGVGRQRVPAGG
jgi:hypothetical protein